MTEPQEGAGGWTVVGVWKDDRPVAFAGTPGDHVFYGYEPGVLLALPAPEGWWAVHVDEGEFERACRNAEQLIAELEGGDAAATST